MALQGPHQVAQKSKTEGCEELMMSWNSWMLFACAGWLMG